MNKVNIRGIELHPFTSRRQIADYAERHPGILVAVNAEKILNQTAQTRHIINNNIGYCDGAGPLMALHSLGYNDAIKVAGCELWLSLVELFHKDKTFYLVGGKQEVIELTVEKLRGMYSASWVIATDIFLLPKRKKLLSTTSPRSGPTWCSWRWGRPSRNC